MVWYGIVLYCIVLYCISYLGSNKVLTTLQDEMRCEGGCLNLLSFSLFFHVLSIRYFSFSCTIISIRLFSLSCIIN